MYLLKTAKGKENLVSSILKKYGLEIHPTPEKEYLVCNARPSPELLFRFETYFREVVEVTDEEAQRLLRPEDKGVGVGEIKVGGLVQVISGPYQDFKGIARRIVDDRAVIDLNVFGRISPVEVCLEELEPLQVAEPWV